MEVLHPYAGWLLICFVIGYFLITLEHVTQINKATMAILTGVISWIIFFLTDIPHEESIQVLNFHLAKIAQIIFFLFGALTVVEIVNLHDGFNIIKNWVEIRSKRKLLWVMGFMSFFLSCVIDNLTTTIVMVAMLKKMIHSRRDRLIVGGAVVIAANAGGAWTPIGDVTTSMLWIGGQVSAVEVIRQLFLSSLVCLVTSVFVLSFQLKGTFAEEKERLEKMHVDLTGKFVFWMGLLCLLSVPFFKFFTGLPPYMGVLFGLGCLWLMTDLIHFFDNKEHLKVPYALTRIDASSMFFFLGVLLCISALEASKVLHVFSEWLDRTIANPELIAVAIGLFSAVVDNIPLVAAAMGMYPLTTFPTDSSFWMLIAYCAGTGGSILIIGSAAGIVFMGLEKVDFFWFIKKISFAALLGYFLGVAVYLAMQTVF